MALSQKVARLTGELNGVCYGKVQNHVFMYGEFMSITDGGRLGQIFDA